MSTTPDAPWWQGATIYQIYPRSFADSSGDGVGDLAGITSRLDYVTSLGVDAIWLSPFFPSPMADFGYDVADYTGVDPRFGTLADFDHLLSEAHARGIRVVIDWVPNHSSDQHPWFIESRRGRDSPKRDWYVWRDPAPDGGPPNGWVSNFRAVGPAWTYDEASGQYYLHSFLPEQPELNWDNPEVRAAMADTLRFWLDRGVDGFRIDVVFKLAKDPALGENEPDRRHDQDWQPTIHERLRELRRVADEYDDRMLVGEVYLDDLPRVAAYINSGEELHLAHNFVFVRLPWRARAFRESIEEFTSLSTSVAWPTWLLENHDHGRVPSRYADGPEPNRRRGRVALMLVLALRGTAFLFQGQELGLPDAEVPGDRIVDVDGRDPERAPIPWRRPSDAGPGAGFTTGEPWLPLVADAESLCVEAQEGDPASALTFTQRLLAFHRDSETLRRGTQRFSDAPEGVLSFVRERGGERLLVALNFTSRPVTVELGGAGATIALSTDPARPLGRIQSPAALGPDEGLILRLARSPQAR
jgi:alpha-glucosidase